MRVSMQFPPQLWGTGLCEQLTCSIGRYHSCRTSCHYLRPFQLINHFLSGSHSVSRIRRNCSPLSCKCCLPWPQGPQDSAQHMPRQALSREACKSATPPLLHLLRRMNSIYPGDGKAQQHGDGNTCWYKAGRNYGLVGQEATIKGGMAISSENAGRIDQLQQNCNWYDSGCCHWDIEQQYM